MVHQGYAIQRIDTPAPGPNPAAIRPPGEAFGSSIPAGIGAVLALGGLGAAAGVGAMVAPAVIGVGALVAGTGIVDEVSNFRNARQTDQNLERFAHAVEDNLDRGMNRETAEYEATRHLGFAPPGPQPQQWREMLIRRPGYGYALQTMHILYQDPIIRPFVEHVMQGAAVPTELHVTELYKLLGQPGVDPRAAAFAEQVQDRIRALRFSEMDQMSARGSMQLVGG